MTDPFRSAAIRDRARQAAALLAVAAMLGALWYLQFGSVRSNGTALTAQVLRFGMDPAPGFAGGDRPVLTVRLPDGSIRDVRATWADVDNCRPGRFVSLVKRGAAVRIGQPGCKLGETGPQ